MRCPDKRVMAVMAVVFVIIVVTVISVVNGVNIFRSKTVTKNNDKNLFENSPHSTSNNLHVVITGSVVGIIILIIT